MHIPAVQIEGLMLYWNASEENAEEQSLPLIHERLPGHVSLATKEDRLERS